MEINKNLSEFVWDYISRHDFVSRTTLSGMYIDKFGIGARRVDRKLQQKTIERKIGLIFRVMKTFGMIDKFSQRTIKVNRAVFNNFTLEDVLKYSFKQKLSKNS